MCQSLQKIKCVLKSRVSCKMKVWKSLKCNEVIKSSLKKTFWELKKKKWDYANVRMCIIKIAYEEHLKTSTAPPRISTNCNASCRIQSGVSHLQHCNFRYIFKKKPQIASFLPLITAKRSCDIGTNPESET